MSGSCLTLIDLLIYGLTLITVIVSCVAFGMVIHAYRKLKAAGLLEEKGNPKQGRKMSGSTWNKIGDDSRNSKGNLSTTTTDRRNSGVPERRQNERVMDRRQSEVPGRNYSEEPRRISQNIIRSPREDPLIHSTDF